MALSRVFQKIFGKNATLTDLGVVGSKNENNPQYSKNIADLQSLANWETGMRAIVTASDAPYLQDHNSLFYVITTQLAYLFQAGVPEWNAQTEYFMNRSIVLRNGILYRAIADNINQDPEVHTAKWKIVDTSWGNISGSIGKQKDLISLVSGGYYAACYSSASSIQKDITISDTLPLNDNFPVIPDGTRIRVRFATGSNVLLWDSNNGRPFLNVSVNGETIRADIKTNGGASSSKSKFWCCPHEIVEFVFYGGDAYFENTVSYVLEQGDGVNNNVRIYRDGWCEQSGRVENTSNSIDSWITINFEKEFADTNYQIYMNPWGGKLQSGANNMAWGVKDASTSSAKIIMYAIDLNSTHINWKAEGYIK